MSPLQHQGGRRFLLSAATLLMTGILTWFGKLDGSVYAAVIIAVVGAYVTGNTVQKVFAPKGTENG